VALKENRTTLPEYALFRDMWCEVQVQTSLNHAWSEMAHDTIYKKPKIEGFGGKLFQSIEKRMQTIMRKFLLPAGYEFQKVLDDFERLSAGKEVFDQGGLEALADCDDNNARHDLLERFAKSVLPIYDDVQSVYPDVRASVIAAVKEARKTPTRPIETPFGALSGHSVEQIVDIAADILEKLRYVDVEAAFDTICELFPGAQSDEERKRLLQLAEHLSKHELEVWKQAGPLVQSILVKKIQDLDDELLDSLRPVLFKVLAEVLKPEVTGTSSTYKSVTFHTGAVQTSEALTHARADAIGVLKELYRKARTDAERRAVRGALSAATVTPHNAEYSNALLKTILENTCEIVNFYTEIADSQSHETLQRIEHDLLWLYRRNRDMPTDTATDPAIAEARESLTKSILAFRDRINTDRGFVVYKTLVGFDFVFPPAWENVDFDVDGEQAYREERIQELVEEVREESADEWLAILKRCARTESEDGATFQSFGHFLELLGDAKPQIVLQYLDRLDGSLANFLPAMLCGLSRGQRKDDARKRIARWLKEKAHLQQIATYLRTPEEFDAGLLQGTLNAAIENDDDVAVLIALGVAVARHKDHPGGLIDTVFIPALSHLMTKKDSRWVNAAWHDPNKHSLFRDLTPQQVDAVLGSLVSYPHIEYRSETILTSIADSCPKKVIDFFGQRLRFSETAEAKEKYEAIPFDLHKLHEPLSKIPDYVVDLSRAWFDENDSLFTYRAGRLISIIFPRFSQQLQEKLMSLVRSGERQDVEFVINLLRSYHGEAFLHDVCKEIVEALPPDDPLLEEVDIVLVSTGVVSGEFGFVAAYKRKKSEIEPWLTDKREKIKAFAERHLRTLDRQIAAEQRGSEQRLEQRKRDYGEEPDEEG
jgi:hypothetical protein